MNTLEIKSEYITLGAALKLSGIADSGARAKDIILDGMAKVNGELCEMRGKKLRDGDVFSAYKEEFRVKIIDN